MPEPFFSDEAQGPIRKDCRHWHSNELLPIAYSLAEILMKEPKISGVAITGSVARFESHVHDIDLIVFHNGEIKDATCSHDSLGRRDNLKANTVHTEHVEVGDGYGTGTRTVSVHKFVTAPIYAELSLARKEVPVHYIFVHEKILLDCGYLQSFLPRVEGRGLFGRIGFRLKESMKAREERIVDEFYATVFCEIPLLLVDPANSRAGLWQYVCACNPSGVPINRFLNIQHKCSDARCKPRSRWANRRFRVKAKQGYACVEEQRKRAEAARGGLSLGADNSGALSYPQDGEVSLVRK